MQKKKIAYLGSKIVERRDNGARNTIISFKVTPPMTRRPSIKNLPLTASTALPNNTL